MEIVADCGSKSGPIARVRRDALGRFSGHTAAVRRCVRGRRDGRRVRAVSAGISDRLYQVRFGHATVVSTALEATKYLCPLCVTGSMLGLLQLGGIGTVPAALVGLVLIAIVLLVGRLVMKVAWRLVIIGIIVVGTIWLLGLLGFGVL